MSFEAGQDVSEVGHFEGQVVVDKDDCKEMIALGFSVLAGLHRFLLGPRPDGK